uniref:Uncharacterized protein n=1 Tax=Amphimedon queenslandica TaxID=400682 RepID=A0A1X7U379_AMPQE
MSFQLLNIDKPNSVKNIAVFALFEAPDSFGNHHIALDRYKGAVSDIQESRWSKVQLKGANDCVKQALTEDTIGRRSRHSVQYNNYTAEDRARIGKYAVENGPTRAARHFSAIWNMKINESTARRLKSEYIAQLNERKDEEVSVTSLVKKIHWDHTGLPLVPTGEWKMHYVGDKVIPVSNVDDKSEITAVLAASMTAAKDMTSGWGQKDMTLWNETFLKPKQADSAFPETSPCHQPGGKKCQKETTSAPQVPKKGKKNKLVEETRQRWQRTVYWNATILKGSYLYMEHLLQLQQCHGHSSSWEVPQEWLRMASPLMPKEGCTRQQSSIHNLGSAAEHPEVVVVPGGRSNCGMADQIYTQREIA